MSLSSNEHYMPSINIFLSSDKADVNHSSSHKTFYLSKPINVPKHTTMLIALSQFNMPYSFYLIRAGVNDSFNISTYLNSVWVNKTITVPEGNYSIGELIPAINTLFINYSVELRTTFFLVLNYTTNKFYITCSVQMDSVIIDKVLCYKILGVQNTNAVLTYNYLTTLLLPNMCDFSGESCLYVALKHRSIHNMNSSNVDGVLQQINIRCLPLEYIIYTDEIQYFETSSEHVNRFDISILDENFNLIELNGGIFRLTFTIHFNYNRPVIHDKQITYEEEDEEDEDKQKTKQLKKINKIKNSVKV